MDNIRSAVRPFISVTGWLTVLGLCIYFAVKFGTPDIAMIFIGIVIGAVNTAIGYWFGERKK
ncbi:hypothetical protein LCGC14_3088020 [marine sediment metagenome]|uniref:Uncharacterized protein n=1 Tax=marine sediment metagenome TaxID=412755 RepID=A0A0F8X000_9ZZZZ